MRLFLSFIALFGMALNINALDIPEIFGNDMILQRNTQCKILCPYRNRLGQPLLSGEGGKRRSVEGGSKDTRSIL